MGVDTQVHSSPHDRRRNRLQRSRCLEKLLKPRRSPAVPQLGEGMNCDLTSPHPTQPGASRPVLTLPEASEMLRFPWKPAALQGRGAGTACRSAAAPSATPELLAEQNSVAMLSWEIKKIKKTGAFKQEARSLPHIYSN